MIFRQLKLKTSDPSNNSSLLAYLMMMFEMQRLYGVDEDGRWLWI
jgi:hypothetical protein